jgi:hypothetical protein
MLFVSSNLDIGAIENLSADKLAVLQNPPTLDFSQWTVLNPLYPIFAIWGYIQYIFALMSISTTYQLLAVILTPFTILFALIMISYVFKLIGAIIP